MQTKAHLTCLLRTSPIDNRKGNSHSDILSYLGEAAKDLIFGPDGSMNQQASNHVIPLITIFLVVSNDNQADLVTSLFQNSVPCRIYKIKPKDLVFGQPDDIAKEWMLMDTAPLTIHRCLHDRLKGLPYMVFHAGAKIITCTCVWKGGRFETGLIGLAVQASLKCPTSWVPKETLTMKDVRNLLGIGSNRDVPIATRVDKSDRLGPIRTRLIPLLQRILYSCLASIKYFVEQEQEATAPICVVGPEADILQAILNQARPLSFLQKVQYAIPEYTVEVLRYHHHFAVASVLKNAHQEHPKLEQPEWALKIIGNRVSKHVEGSTRSQGTVIKYEMDVDDDDPIFFIRYDDSNCEELDAEELHGGLCLSWVMNSPVCSLHLCWLVAAFELYIDYGEASGPSPAKQARSRDAKEALAKRFGKITVSFSSKKKQSKKKQSKKKQSKKKQRKKNTRRKS